MNKLWVRIALIVVIVGVVASGIYFYVSQKKAKNNSDKILVSDKPFLDENVNNNEKEQVSGEYTLSISKIGLTAPIIINVDGNNKETYMKALEDGVAHLKDSALPGAPGNTAIFGHSSYYANKPGSYKKVFATLNNLETDDTIEIKSSNKTYDYKVTNKLIVKPQDVSVVSQDLSKYELTLITCWPLNTTEKRLVIKASLVQ